MELNTINNLKVTCDNLTIEERKIVIALSKQIKLNDGLKKYRFDLEELAEILNISDKSEYIKIPKITNFLISKILEIETSSTLLLVHLIDSAFYDFNNSYVDIEINHYSKALLSIGANYLID